MSRSQSLTSHVSQDSATHNSRDSSRALIISLTSSEMIRGCFGAALPRLETTEGRTRRFYGLTGLRGNRAEGGRDGETRIRESKRCRIMIIEAVNVRSLCPRSAVGRGSGLRCRAVAGARWRCDDAAFESGKAARPCRSSTRQRSLMVPSHPPPWPSRSLVCPSFERRRCGCPSTPRAARGRQRR